MCRVKKFDVAHLVVLQNGGQSKQHPMFLEARND